MVLDTPDNMPDSSVANTSKTKNQISTELLTQYYYKILQFKYSKTIIKHVKTQLISSPVKWVNELQNEHEHHKKKNILVNFIIVDYNIHMAISNIRFLWRNHKSEVPASACNVILKDRH